MGGYQHVKHTFEPVYNENSKILILGSMPSVKSREQGFYYGHPRNRFWKVLSQILSVSEPKDILEKKTMLLENGIAIWDVIAECDIVGSSDSSIKNVIPVQMERVISYGRIAAVFANGNTAAHLYQKYLQNVTDMPVITLPSTSPANAAYSLDRLVQMWGEQITAYLSLK